MEDETYLTRLCPRCRTTLAADAPQGLCPACLLAAATETLTQATLDYGQTITVQGNAGPPPTEGARLADGQSWGPYRIGRLLGRGGMGEVHEAEHVDTGRRIALKVLHSRLQGADERARFLREGQLAASISHPHTVYIFGSEEISGVPVISMELLPGGTLKDRVVAEGPLPPATAVSAVLDIIGGLDAAHAAGILHRDIKPSNCFVDVDGTVKVGDFGLSISTLARDVQGQLLTGFEGTPQFAAPEQLRGAPLDVRADIYAVGATLYYLLTGQPPFVARDLRELVEEVTSAPPKSPRALRPNIPAGLAAVVLRCLAKSPSQRPASYPALAELLRPFSVSGEAPAPLRLRILAAIVDFVILSIPVTIWQALNAQLVINGQRPPSASDAWVWLLNAVYFFVLEARWGASLGKRFFGLQLSSAGGAGWVARIARRTMVFHLPWMMFALLVVASGPIGPVKDIALGGNSRLNADQTRDLIQGIVTMTLLAALFVTARRHNGWAGLHELASGTRVVSRSSAHRRLGAPTAATAIDMTVPPARARRYGPFVAATEGRDADRQLIIAFDPVLRRRVWINVVPPNTAPVDAVRRDVSRTGRLHWLTGRRSSDDNWDAFEAPDGQPLLVALRGARPSWSTVKAWLLDLSAELLASESDGSTPVLALDRLWIRHDGRLVLLDFPAPGLDADDASRASALSAVELLSAVAARTTPAGTAAPVIMPLSARSLLESWARHAPASLSDARNALARVAAAPDEVRRERRALPLVLTAMPLIFLIAITLFGTLPTIDRFFGPDTQEMLDLLEIVDQPPPGSRLADPEVREAMETYIAGRHGNRLRDAGFWNSPAMQRANGRLRNARDRIVQRYPTVSRDVLERATAVVASDIEERRAQRPEPGTLPSAGFVVSTITALVLLLALLIGLASSLIVPGGVFTRMLGHAVVTRRGREIGRALSLTRVIVAWSPAIVWLLYLAWSPRQGFFPAPPQPAVGVVLTLTALGIGAIATIARPSRGPHDRLLGTWVVPR